MFANAASRSLAWIGRGNHRNALPLSRRAPTAFSSTGRSGYKPQFPKQIFSSSTAFSLLSSHQNDVDDDDSVLNLGDDDVIKEEESESVVTYQPGIPKGFFIVDHTATPLQGFDMDAVKKMLGTSEIDRLKLTSHNVTLPVALMLIDPETYPSLSRARKSCRKGYVLVHRGALSDDNAFDLEKCIRGRVGDRVFAGDVIAQQVRMGNGWYNAQYHEKPPFDLPVVYEDDHFAFVNKPAGIVTYSHRSAGHGRMSVRAALPFYVKAPSPGTFSIISRPIACHRLDKPTSGLVSTC